PSAARRRAHAAPMPVPPPVTITLLPSRPLIAALPLRRSEGDIVADRLIPARDGCKGVAPSARSSQTGGERSKAPWGGLMFRHDECVPERMPELSRGKHRKPRQGACFMELASFLAGERWTDHPACTHPLLAALARLRTHYPSGARRVRRGQLTASVR